MERTDHLTENELALYVDGLRLHRLEALPDDVRDHMQQCLECKRAAMEISAAIPEGVYRRGEAHPFFGSRSSKGRLSQYSRLYVRAAAGIVLLLGVGTMIFYVASHKDTVGREAGSVQVSNQEASPPSEPLEHPAENPPLAAAGSFKPSILYDRLTGEQFRSGSSVRHHPANGDTITAHELLSWEEVKTNGPCTLTVLDNRGGEKVQELVRGKSYRLEKNLTPGLYYWKLEEGGELVFVGKFCVAR